MKIDEAAKYGANVTILQKLKELGITFFTTAQKAAIENGLCGGESLIISAPTSTGKTTIAEIAAIDGALKGQKTVYLVTHKALAEEKYLLFKKSYDTGDERWFEVSIATGDRNEGEWNNGILVATYEKYLGLLSSSNIYFLHNKVVVADEIQIVSDETRGPDIEILFSIVREHKPSQIIALSAAASNVNEIAGWLNCKFINVTHRDVPLRQEVWINGRRLYNYHGDWEIKEDDNNKMVSLDTISAVRNLLNSGFGPILVFTMTKPQATKLADTLSKSHQQDSKSYGIAEQLELFSEPTAITDMLKITSERKVAFHSTDLSFSERSVVENALREKKLDVVFSTPTLAAGVNFPIKTVLFHSFSRSWLSEPWISKSEYINMSGRAGRLGLDEQGCAILIAHNRAESIKAKEYISQDIGPLNSVLLNKSIRKSVMHLLSIRICKNEQDLNKFYSNTFWWFQNQKHNPKMLVKIAPKISESIKWLYENELIEGDENNYNPTPLGKAISSTGLLPSTGVFLLSLLRQNETSFLSSEYELPLIHAVCSCDEFDENIGQRFLPYARSNQPEPIAWKEIKSASLFIDSLNVENYDRVTNAAYGLNLWAQGISEHKLRRTIPAISYGQFHTLSLEVAWILEGLSKISVCPGVKFETPVAAKITLLAEKIRFGAVEEALDVLKAAKRYDVPGLGRQRAMSLFKKGISEPNVLIKLQIEDIAKVVENVDRARALVEAVSQYFSMNLDYWRSRHLRRFDNFKEDRDLIVVAYESLGHDYEDVIEEMIIKIGWKIKKIDTKKRKGVPDFLISEMGKTILLECKTKKRNDATINKEDAFDVITKGVDINADHRVTIGKPDFDTFSKSKAAGSKMVTLVPHYTFVEAFLRWREGKLSPDGLFTWLITPGIASIELLPI